MTTDTLNDAAVTYRDLARQAAEVRLQIVTALGPGKIQHFGGSLSVADIMVALYHCKLRVRPEEPDWPERDRLILSKGHAVPAQYVCLARRGFFPLERLATIRTLGSPLQGHPDMRKTVGLEANTGSLGMGLSVANGIALAGRMRNLRYRVYALLGDGECEEGQVWEAAMTARQYGLDTVTAIVDHNGLQANGTLQGFKNVAPLAVKWRAFGWEALEIDGHDMQAICEAIDQAGRTKGTPTAIIARTVKAKGMPFLEGQVASHCTAVTDEQYRTAIDSLERARARLERG